MGKYSKRKSLDQFLVDVWDKGHFVLLPCSCVKEIVTQEASGNGAISGQAIKFWAVGTSSPVEGDTRVVVTNTWLGVVTNRLAESMTGETLQHSKINKFQFQNPDVKRSISNNPGKTVILCRIRFHASLNVSISRILKVFSANL